MLISLFLCPQSESSLDSSPEGSRRPSPQEAEWPPSLLSSPCVAVRAPSLDALPPHEAKTSAPLSPQPPTAESQDCGGEEGPETEAEGSSEAPSSSTDPASSSLLPPWMKSPERVGLSGPGGLSFSPINSNLRDLTPSHTLEPILAFRPEAVAVAGAGVVAVTVPVPLAAGPFTEAAGSLFYPCPEEGGTLAFSRSLSGDSTGEGGSGQNPPQKKKVSCYILYSACPFKLCYGCWTDKGMSVFV